MKLTILLVFNLAALNFSLAEILTVDNKHPYAGQYQTLQEAHDAASPGDTIYVYPSIVPYSAVTVTKQLSFYGVGFDITENIGDPMTSSASISGSMIFNTGAEGSQLEGFDGSFNVTLNANNITIKKNDLIRIGIYGSGCAILQNKIIGSSTGFGILRIYEGAQNIMILNNIIINLNTGGYTGESTLMGGTDLYVNNNIFSKNGDGYVLWGINNGLFINNIFILGDFIGINQEVIFNYNMANSNQLPEGNGNINNADMNTVFVDYANYDFHLLPSSPAIGTGENGTDMGIYGGDAPYVDGGFPGLPSILQILAPTVGSQQSGLDIQFKVKSNNE